MILHPVRALLVRVGALAFLAVVALGVPVGIVRLIGRPWPTAGRVRDEFGSGHVSTDTTMRIAAALALFVWAWAVAIIIGEAARILRSHPTSGRHAQVVTANRTGAAGVLQALVRVVLVGTITTASLVRVAAPAAAVHVARVTVEQVVGSAASVAAPATMMAGPTVVADGTQTPLSVAVDLGDESLRDEIIRLNRSHQWTAGVFPAGMVVQVPTNTPLIVDLAAPVSSEVSVSSEALVSSDGAVSSDLSVRAYTVRAGDGLWNVAAVLLGDGARYHELHQLVIGQHVAPDVIYTASTSMIHPGWVFTTPVDTSPPQGRHVVRPGESLSAIAERSYGDSAEWPVLWEANKHHTMSDGHVFTDPNLIRPGWTLTIPATPGTERAAPAYPSAGNDEGSATTEVPTPPPTSTPAPPATTTTATSVTTVATAAPAAGTPATVFDDRAQPPVWPPPPTVPAAVTAGPSNAATVTTATSTTAPATTGGHRVGHTSRPWLAGLSGATMLASALLVRYRLLRRRLVARGSHNLAAFELNATEQHTEDAIAAAADTPLTRWANDRLRALITAHGHTGSRIEIVELSNTELRVWWTPALPQPPQLTGWSTDRSGRIWTLAHQPAPNSVSPAVAVIPALVTIGRTDDRSVLVNLESFGGLAITGDPARADDLVRSIVLELGAGGDLSNSVVHTIGLDVDGTEHLPRVRTRAEADVRGHLERLTATHTALLAGRHHPTMFDLRAAAGSEGREVLVVTAHAGALIDPAGLLRLAPPETGVAVVVSGLDDPQAASATITITPTGAAVLEPVGLHLQAAGVPRQTAASISILLDHVAGALTDPTVDPVPLAVPTRDVPAPALLVRVFGVPRIDGHRVGVTELQLLTYLACHGRAVSDDELVDVVWGGRYTRTELWDIVARTRALFGPLIPPRPEGSTVVTITDSVMTDVDWCKHLLGAAHRTSDPHAALVLLTEALDLIVGEPYSAPGFEWADRDNDGSYTDAVRVIETVCAHHAEQAVALGDRDTARHSLQQGLRLLRVNEPLTQQLIGLEHHADNPDAARAAYRSLAAGLVELADTMDITPAATITALLDHGEAPTVEIVERDEPARAPNATPQATRPRVLLRCFGDVAIDGAVVSQAVAVPFVIAAAHRPLTDTDIAEITGYNRKTLSTVWTTTNGILARDGGALTLAEGVWTDYDWLTESVQRARSAATNGDPTAATGWLQRVFLDLARLDGHAFQHPTGKKDYWRWVDEYPADVTARDHAEQLLVEAALAACQQWHNLNAADVIAADQVVVIACNLAQLFPYAPIAGSVRPSDFHTAGECLLLAGHTAAHDRTDLTTAVANTAKRLVANGRIEPSDTLADALQL